ncbi:PERQ amino acid-rich with GYF domain-containing protein, partial [Lecanoromycetidae sp. Uapishka_2]
MPSPFTSSFASAAAGNTGSESTPNGRNTGSGDWSRARTNGATATFRRPSVATNSSYSRDGPQSNNNPPPSAGSVFSQEGTNISSPPPSLLRRKTDHKETFGPSLDDKDRDDGRQGNDSGNDMPGFREIMQHRDYSQQQTPQARNQGMSQLNEPMSPTNTNPYQSPEGPQPIPEDNDTDDPDLHHMPYPGGAQFGQTARAFHNQMDDTRGDRSQTSSRGGGRAYPSLGGLGNLNGLAGGSFSAAPGAIGTPSRAQPSYPAAFGDSGFGALNDLTSPQGGLGGGSFFGAGGTGPTGRGSKLSALLPNAMQEQMRSEMSRQEQGFSDNIDAFQRNSGHDAPGFGLRESESSSRLARSGTEDLFANPETRNRALHNLVSSFAANDPIPSSQAPLSNATQTPFSAGPAGSSYFARSQEQESSPGQMPASQQKQMVMPDRMRWIYRDPQGNTQGPWSGLEMHDWYKAGFFSPELQVKKLEDADYEPLAQLIRRIGNSREPFLVPQIGIPHGSSAAQPSSSAATVGAIPATTPSAAQPPFASSFPSFGTTLSAEQQNALERRKQEEQYLMARQKEHLAQQQLALKQIHHMQSGHLHHQSSAHSLQSQPSYGSITSPMGYQPSPAQGSIQPPASASGSGFFNDLSRGTGPLGADLLSSVREEDMPGFMERFNNLGRSGQLPFGQDGQVHQQHVAAVMQERARQQREQEQFDMLRQGNDDQRLAAERLEQYHQLRAQEEQQQQYQQPTPIGGQANHQISELDLRAQQHHEEAEYQNQLMTQNQKLSEPPSLSEQVQKAVVKQTSSVQPQSPWAKVDVGMPQPFPPPQSQSPMPAPTPQRNRQSVADALNAESQSPSRTESTDTPSAAMAPWAKESTEGSKGPSLKEIQAMEAKKAAQQEEMAVAARRAVAEQERLAQQNQAVAPAPGLPSSANWASSISPAVPASTGTSAWAKPATGKPAIATPVAGAKKTLAQIQKEEEARKNRLAATAAANVANNAATPTAGSKRYAELASKVAAPTQPVNTAWTTVGASGKVKTPVTAAPGLTTRTASGGIVQPNATAARPKTTVGTSGKGPGSQQHANEEFHKWTKSALIDNFVTELLVLPPDPEIISDSIYASSQTLDGRRFAEEFVRRRKLADRGIVPDSSTNTGFSSPSNTNESKGGGGWSEVAKKGPANGKEEPNSAFKVVAGKKKGVKR